MDSATDNPTEAAQRLEHALERIALAMATSMAHQPDAPAAPAASQEATEIKARLDALIGKLRAGLADRAR